MHAYNSPNADCLFQHMKRNLPLHGEEKIYGGRYSPVDLLAVIVRYGRELLLSQQPGFKDYPQFGGNKKPAEELGIGFGVPCDWTIETTTLFRKAIAAGGYTDSDALVPEPIAAARHAAQLGQIHLNDGDLLLVCDIGYTAHIN